MRLPNQGAVDANNLLHLSLLQADISKREYAPSLAESMPAVQLVGDSLMRLRYSIRPAAAWDTGQPITARDVAFTLKLMFCPGLPNESARHQFGFIKAVLPDPQSAQRFTIECRGQAPEYVLASGDFCILPEATLDPQGQLRHFMLADLQRRPATAPPDAALQAVAARYQAATLDNHPNNLPGCGAYRLAKWEKDRYLSFRRKPRWWARSLSPTSAVLQAHSQQIDYAIIPDAATATLALRRGDVDLYPEMPAREFARLRASPDARAKLRFYTTDSYDVLTVGFNTRHPALADALTRQALARCFDAAGLLQATQLGSGQRTAGIISPAARPNYNDSLPLLPFSPSSAEALLRRAGWQRSPGAGWFRQGARGQRQVLQLVVRYRTADALFATTALQFQAAAAGIGVPVTLRPTESGAFSKTLQAGDFDLYIRLLKGNPFMFNFTPMLHSLGLGAGNITGFHTPASDQLIEAIATASSPELRAQRLRRFQVLLQQEMPLVPLFFLTNRIAASSRLTGLQVGSLKPGYMVGAIKRAPNPSPAP